MKSMRITVCFLAAAAISSFLFIAHAGGYEDAFNAFINNSNWANYTPWGESQTPKSTKKTGWGSFSCRAYAQDFFTEVWDKGNMATFSESEMFTDPLQITDGDIIYAAGKDPNGDYHEHYYVVLQRYADGRLYTAEGNMLMNSGPNAGQRIVLIRDNCYSVNNPSGDGAPFVCGWHMPGYVSVPTGSEMTTGYGRTLPDGDYLIAAAGTSSKSSFYYLDIAGTDQPAENYTNVILTGPLTGEPPSHEIWTVSYQSGTGFYRIFQKKKNTSDRTMDLDIHGASKSAYANAEVYNVGTQWAIRGHGSGGYYIQPRHSGGGDNGMYLDITGGAVNTSGTNIRQDKHSTIFGTTQSWLFIPYKPSQPISDGRYIILSGADPSWEVDIPGETGNVSDRTAVRLWDDSAASRYNAFDLEKLSNGYYKITHAASGKVLEIWGGSNSYSSGPSLNTSNGSYAQQWAIKPMGNGYSLQPRVNGFYIEIKGSDLSNGAGIRQYTWTGNANQTWAFVPAEYTVRYEPDGSGILLADQTKYYKEDIVLDRTIPEKDGYTFLGWSTSPGAADVEYDPGDTYRIDADLTLYPVWESNCTLYFDANGGEYEVDHIGVGPDGTTALPVTLPVREGYVFLGWSVVKDSGIVDHTPGEPYTADEDSTLYAVWQADKAGLMVVCEVNGKEQASFEGIAAFDLSIRGPDTDIERTACTECLEILPRGCAYKLSNIRAVSPYCYIGIAEGEVSGTASGGNTRVVLSFASGTVNTLPLGSTLVLSGYAPSTEGVTYTSSQPDVVSVTSSGIAKALKIGASLITITSNGRESGRLLVKTINSIISAELGIGGFSGRNAEEVLVFDGPETVQVSYSFAGGAPSDYVVELVDVNTGAILDTSFGNKRISYQDGLSVCKPLIVQYVAGNREVLYSCDKQQFNMINTSARDMMRLPADLKALENEALLGTSARYVTIPAGVETIGRNVLPSGCVVFINADVPPAIDARAFPQDTVVIDRGSSYHSEFAAMCADNVWKYYYNGVIK